jgi:hypothetical protein
MYQMSDFDALNDEGKKSLCESARAAISAAIAADREPSRAEIERLKDELAEARAAALSAVSDAEAVLAKTIASIPVAMTAAEEKEREACARLAELSTGNPVRKTIAAAIRDRGEAK